MDITWDVTTILIAAVVIVVLFVLFRIFKFLTNIILLVVVLVVAYFTNPDEEQHRSAVRQKEKNQIINLKYKVVTKDLWVISLTQIKRGDDIKTVGIGLFSNVFIFRDPK